MGQADQGRKYQDQRVTTAARIPRRQLSVERGAGSLDHCAPLGDLLAHERCKLFGRTTYRLSALTHQPLFHLVGVYDRGNRRVDRGGYGARSAGARRTSGRTRAAGVLNVWSQMIPRLDLFPSSRRLQDKRICKPVADDL